MRVLFCQQMSTFVCHANYKQKYYILAPKLYHDFAARVKRFCKYIFCVVFLHLARFLRQRPNANHSHLHSQLRVCLYKHMLI